jgi:hypothetical protein
LESTHFMLNDCRSWETRQNLTYFIARGSCIITASVTDDHRGYAVVRELEMMRLPLVITFAVMLGGPVQAQYNAPIPGGLPGAAPAIPSPVMPAPALPAPQIPAPAMPAPTLPAPVQIAPPPGAGPKADQHIHPPEVCDCYRTTYDQQGRATRLFNGRSHACCP